MFVYKVPMHGLEFVDKKDSSLIGVRGANDGFGSAVAAHYNGEFLVGAPGQQVLDQSGTTLLAGAGNAGRFRWSK